MWNDQSLPTIRWIAIETQSNLISFDKNFVIISQNNWALTREKKIIQKHHNRLDFKVKHRTTRKIGNRKMKVTVFLTTFIWIFFLANIKVIYTEFQTISKVEKNK